MSATPLLAANATSVVSTSPGLASLLASLDLSGWRSGAAVLLLVAALLFICSRKVVSIHAARLTTLLKDLGRKRSRSGVDSSNDAAYGDGDISDDEEQRDGTRRRGKKPRPVSRQTSPLPPSTQQPFELEPLIRTESSSSADSTTDQLTSPTSPTNPTNPHQPPTQPPPPLPSLLHHLPHQPLLTPRLQAALLPYLPPLLSHVPHWHLVYSTAVHGHSLSTLYELSGGDGEVGGGVSDGCLLVCRDSDGWVFGCWTSERWQRRDLYYGGAESFVFTWQPTFKVYEAREETRRKKSRERRQRREEERSQHSRIGIILEEEEEKQHGEQQPLQEADSEDEDKDSVTGMSGAGYYQLAKNEHIALGGGDRFALWLDSAFRDGTSGPCSTFDSPTLSKRQQFKCYELEVWGM